MTDNNATNELLKLAEEMEMLAEALAKEPEPAVDIPEHTKTASRRAAIDYGTLGDDLNANGVDPLTRFALG